MNKIQRIQTFLGVTADGSFGPKSYAALQAATPPVIMQVQGVLGVTQDGQWGALSRGALQALLSPALPDGWSRCITSEFATASDLKAYNAAIAAGKTQEEAFAVGDNCVGCWDDNTGGPDPMCALPPEIIERTWGIPWKITGRHQIIQVQSLYGGKIISATVADVMPHLAHITNGAGMDSNPALCSALGLPSGAMVPVLWRPA